MANRKQLKKSIKMITGDLFADCVALSMFVFSLLSMPWVE